MNPRKGDPSRAFEARSFGRSDTVSYTQLYVDKRQHQHRTPLSGGVIEVEGGLYFPSLPDTLVEATADFRAEHIDLPTYRARINNRAIYQMRVHDTLADGRVRLDCPAAGACPKAICPLKPKSAEPRPTTLTPAGQKIDTRPTIKITKHVSKDHPPKVCAAAHVTINPVSYTHLDVYKRQHEVLDDQHLRPAAGEVGRVVDP